MPPLNNVVGHSTKTFGVSLSTPGASYQYVNERCLPTRQLEPLSNAALSFSGSTGVPGVYLLAHRWGRAPRYVGPALKPSPRSINRYDC